MNELLASFALAVERLREAMAEPETAIARDAAIQRFEFCFELAWKAIQKALRRDGLDCATPRTCLKAAYRRGWIAEEEPWLAMLDDRDLTSHTYDEELARKVYGRLGRHAETLSELVERLRAEAAS